MMRRNRLLLTAATTRWSLLLLACAACGAGREAPRDEDLDGARAQVQAFFAAVARGDCATLGGVYAPAAEPAACAKLVHEWTHELRIRLIEIPDVRRDGRDRRAIIVKAQVWRSDQQQTMLVRVTHDGGTWQIAL